MKITFEAAAGEPEAIIRGDADDPRVQRLLSACQQAAGSGKLFLYREGRAFVHGYDEVDWFEAGDGHVFAHVAGQTLEAKAKLYELAGAARPHGFVQIGKGVLVNVARVQSVEVEFSGNYLCTLRDGKTRLTISRKYVKGFRQYVLEVM